MKKREYEEHRKAFLQVREILTDMNENFALTRAFKKPVKWYGQHSIDEAVSLLIAETDKVQVTILGYYTRKDGGQYIHYMEDGKEWITSGVRRWLTNIQNTLSTMKRVAHLPDREKMMTYLKRCQTDSAITEYMNQMVGEISFTQNGVVGEVIPYTSKPDYVKAVEEEIEYRSSSGFQYKTFTHDPEVRKSIDDIVYDLYGEKNPHDLNYYKNEMRERHQQMKNNNTMEKIEEFAEKHNVPIYEEMPEGFHINEGALTAPVGAKWIKDNGSVLEKTVKRGLLLDKEMIRLCESQPANLNMELEQEYQQKERQHETRKHSGRTR